MKKRTVFEIAIILFIASAVIFFQFNQVPKKLSWDEVEFTRLALSLDGKSYTPYSQLATGHSTLYFYIILLSFKLFGITNFALRLPSALFGIGNIVLFYCIVKNILKDIHYFKSNLLKHKLPLLGPYISLLPLLLSLIFITTRWYFNFARFSFEATFLLFLELAALFFLFRFLKDKKLPLLIATGVFSGLAFLSYYPGRIFFLLPLFFLTIQKDVMRKYLAIFLGTVLLIASPLLIYLTTHKDLRVEQQLFLTDKKLTFQNKVEYVHQNISKLLGMFNTAGDLNGRHNYPGKPTLNPILGAFFILGFLVAILNWKLFPNQLFLVYFALSLAPTLLTYPAENPNSLRTFTAVVPVLYFIGNGIVYLLQSESKSKLLLLLVTVGLVVLFTLSSLYDLRTYFLYQRVVFQKAFELNGNIQRILNLKLWEKTNSL